MKVDRNLSQTYRALSSAIRQGYKLEQKRRFDEAWGIALGLVWLAALAVILAKACGV